jgi:hypothetical protein
LWRLTQADTLATAVFVDELDAGQFQVTPNRQIVSRRHGRLAVGQLGAANEVVVYPLISVVTL